MTPAIDELLNKTFDYVIIGGGTAGLTLASILSSDPLISIIVLEAGQAHEEDDPNIAIPGQFGSQFGKEKYSYTFQTTPQANANNKQYLLDRGKGLGGSSNINFQCWITPPAQDVGAFEALGNPGWNWNNYVKYQRRVEERVTRSVPRGSEVLDAKFLDTLDAMGLKRNADPYSGDNVGHFVALASINPKTWMRSHAANSYYLPVKSRSNLTVITEAIVARVLFDDSIAGDLVAIGAEFIHNEKKYVVKCNKEVILSAGSIKTPQILELSGIGRRDVLEKLGVEVKLELPGVGENVQEHYLIPVTYETVSDKSFETLDLLRNPDYLEQGRKFHAEGKGTPAVHPTCWMYIPLSTASPEAAPEIIKKVELEVETLKRSGTLPPGLAEQFDIQLSNLRDPKIPDCQVILFPGYWPCKVPPEEGKTYITFFCVINHPFSRGYIHAKSLDPAENPEVETRYFDFDFDMELTLQHLYLAQKIATQEPLKSVLVKEINPGAEYTDDKLRDFVNDNLNTAWHTTSSCSMLPRENNGVVSPELVVYGTKNLRIVDLSIAPLQLATHTQSVAYSIGEKAADIIRGL